MGSRAQKGKSTLFKTIVHISLLFVSLFVWQSCAVQADPLGGPEDTIAPVPNPYKSTPNEQVFFKKQDIRLVFDEWVKLKNANQIIVSPPLEKNVEAKLKGKSVIISFDKDEVLYENTTYTVNMGQAIVDYTADNPMANYTFVFSTGSFIDSLGIKGQVVDDFTGEPKENVIVSLYDNLADTAIYTTRPLYFTRTDDQGKYSIQNVRQDTFRIFTLDDKNLNYFKDQESEGMGFLKDSVFLDTSLTKPVNLGFFLPIPKKRITEKTISPGFVKLGFNTFISDVEYNLGPEIQLSKSIRLKDSLLIWYEAQDSSSLIVETTEEKQDTFELGQTTDSIIQKRKLKLGKTSGNLKTTLGPKDSIVLQFPQPILSANESLIKLIDTSGNPRKYGIKIDVKDPRKLRIKSSWIEGQRHKLEFLPEALEVFGASQKDTIIHPFVVATTKTVGEIIFELDSLKENYQYIVELKQGSKEYIRLVSNVTEEKLTFTGLKPGKYTVKIYEDVNKNGRWDSGDFRQNRYSEKWISKTLESLKANWTLEATVHGKEFK